MSELISVIGAEFSASASREGGRVALSLAGNAGPAAIDPLAAVLTRVHVEARQLAVTEAVIDLRDLESMSSSCFESVAVWISDIQDLPPVEQYRLTFRSDPARQWQRRNLHALRCLAAELITVEA